MKPHHIIFDLTGVIFQPNRLKQFHTIGLWKSLRYIITHRESPINRFLHLLTQLYELQPNGYPIIYYKRIPLPQCISDFMCGYTDSKTTATIINNYVETLIKQNYFRSNLEIYLMQQIIQTLINDVFALRPNWTMIEFVRKLKKNNYTLYLLSNFDKESYTRLLCRYPDIFALFENIVISAHIQMLKPYKEIYNYILTKYHLLPEECLFIDDQEENVQGAQDLGIKGLHYTNFNLLLKDFKNYI